MLSLELATTKATLEIRVALLCEGGNPLLWRCGGNQL
jgi:hypothetical protein